MAILLIRDHADAALEKLSGRHGFMGVAEIGKAINFSSGMGAPGAGNDGRQDSAQTTLFAKQA